MNLELKYFKNLRMHLAVPVSREPSICVHYCGGDCRIRKEKLKNDGFFHSDSDMKCTEQYPFMDGCIDYEPKEKKDND